MNSDRDIDELIDEFGVVGAIRYMEQFDGGGSGDYTKEKSEKPEPTYEEIQEFHNRVLNRQMVQEEVDYAGECQMLLGKICDTEKGQEYKSESSVDFEGLFKYMDDNNLKFDDMTENEMKMFVKDWDGK